MDPEAQLRILDELRRARREREGGNEGKARVCARRAAGWAAAELNRRREPASEAPASVLALLAWFRDLDAVPRELREAADRLIRHVRPDHSLPHAEDPLEDAERIVRAVLEGGVE